MLPDESVPQPDVVVMLNAHRETLQDAYILGTPDLVVTAHGTWPDQATGKYRRALTLVVEVNSSSTATPDRRAKVVLYARAGVSGQWIADPYAQSVECFSLEGEAYASAGVYRGEAAVPSGTLPGFPMLLERFFR